VDRVAKEVLQIVDSLKWDCTANFTRSGETSDKTLNTLYADICRWVDKVRANENFDVFIARKDSDTEMIVMVDFENCDAKEAIVRELSRRIQKLSRKCGAEVSIGKKS